MAFDSEYAKFSYKIGSMLARAFFDDLHILNKQNLHHRPGKPRLYLGNHLSHADYTLFWITLYAQGIRIPALAAGKNLDRKVLKLAHLDFGKLGAFWIDREALAAGGKEGTQNKREIILASREIESSGSGALIFPEGGRSYSGSVMEGKFYGALIRTLFHLNPDVVPVAFAYDNRYEGWVLPFLEKHKAEKNWKYYWGESAALLARPFVTLAGNSGKAYINFGRPTPLEEIASGNQRQEKLATLEDFTRREIKRLYSEISEVQKSLL